MDAIVIVNQLRTLASSPENRAHIISQGCLPGLVMFLDNADDDVIYGALETLHYISLYTANCERMATEPGLLDGLKTLSATGSVRASRLSVVIFRNLKAAGATAALQPTAAANANATATPAAAAAAPAATTAAATVSGPAKTYVLHVRGLTTETRRAKVETALLSVRGVVSFLFDLERQRATVRSHTAADALADAVRAKAGLFACLESQCAALGADQLREAERLVKAAEAAERAALGDAATSAAAVAANADVEANAAGGDEDDDAADDKENAGSDAPAYLTEEPEEEASCAAASKGSSSWSFWGGIVPHGEAYKKPAEADGAQNGWFGRVGRALWG